MRGYRRSPRLGARMAVWEAPADVNPNPDQETPIFAMPAKAALRSGSVKLTDADLVECHGRSALHVLSEERFRKALDELNAVGRRLDLRAKSGFQKTVEALSDVMGPRVSA